MQQASQFLKDLTERLSNALPAHLKDLKNDWEKNVQSILTSAFNKLEIVTREEFDAQTKVLARTRQKISTLEAQVAALEALVKQQTGV
jgi:ubiquinone biosynthesis accessory factor UbiK